MIGGKYFQPFIADYATYIWSIVRLLPKSHSQQQTGRHTYDAHY